MIYENFPRHDYTLKLYKVLGLSQLGFLGYKGLKGQLTFDPSDDDEAQKQIFQMISTIGNAIGQTTIDYMDPKVINEEKIAAQVAGRTGQNPLATYFVGRYLKHNADVEYQALKESGYNYDYAYKKAATMLVWDVMTTVIGAAKASKAGAVADDVARASADDVAKGSKTVRDIVGETSQKSRTIPRSMDETAARTAAETTAGATAKTTAETTAESTAKTASETTAESIAEKTTQTGSTVVEHGDDMTLNPKNNPLEGRLETETKPIKPSERPHIEPPEAEYIELEIAAGAEGVERYKPVERVEREIEVFEEGGSNALEGAAKIKFKIRVIDEILDAELLQKVKEIRSSFTGKFKDGNFGYLEVDIQGIDKSEFYAHSKIKNFEQIKDKEFANKVVDISREYSEAESIFKPLKVNSQNIIDDSPNGWLRNVDTEAKMLEDLARRLDNIKQPKGSVKLFTELPPCPSCIKVIREFSERHPSINIEVVHN